MGQFLMIIYLVVGRELGRVPIFPISWGTKELLGVFQPSNSYLQLITYSYIINPIYITQQKNPARCLKLAMSK